MESSTKSSARKRRFSSASDDLLRTHKRARVVDMIDITDSEDSNFLEVAELNAEHDFDIDSTSQK